MIRQLDKKCSEAKKQRQSYINQAKRYSSNPDAYDMYLQKAEEVDMSYCKTLHQDIEALKAAGKDYN